NVFTTVDSQKPETNYGHGIEITYVKNIRIFNNIFKGINGRAITLAGSDFDIDNLTISNSSCENINAAGNHKYKYMIEFKAVGNIGKLVVQDNKVDRSENFFDFGKNVKIKEISEFRNYQVD